MARVRQFPSCRERVGSGNHPEQPRGASQKVPTGPGILVDGGFDSQQQFRRTLDLIDRQQFKRVDEADRVGDGRGSVQRPVEITALGETISGDDADESAFADLASSADQDDAGVGQCGVHLRFRATWDEVGRGHTPCHLTLVSVCEQSTFDLRQADVPSAAVQCSFCGSSSGWPLAGLSSSLRSFTLPHGRGG
jgi:hypothetical protein